MCSSRQVRLVSVKAEQTPNRLSFGMLKTGVTMETITKKDVDERPLGIVRLLVGADILSLLWVVTSLAERRDHHNAPEFQALGHCQSNAGPVVLRALQVVQHSQ